MSVSNSQPLVCQGYINLTQEIARVMDRINIDLEQQVRYSGCVALFESHLEPLLEKSRREASWLETALKPEEVRTYTLQQANMEAQVARLRQKMWPAEAVWFAAANTPEDPVHHMLSFLDEADLALASSVSSGLQESSKVIPDHLLGEMGQELGVLVKKIKSVLTREELESLEPYFENLAALQCHEGVVTFCDVSIREAHIQNNLCQLYRLMGFERFKSIRSVILNTPGFPVLRQMINSSLDLRVIEEGKEALEKGVEAQEFWEILQLLLLEEGRFHATNSAALFLIRNQEIEKAFYIMDKQPEIFLKSLRHIVTELVAGVHINPEGDAFSHLVNVIRRFTSEGSQSKEEILKLALETIHSIAATSENREFGLEDAIALIRDCTNLDCHLRVSLLEEILPHLWNNSQVNAVEAITILTEPDSSQRTFFLNKLFDYVYANAQNLEAFSAMQQFVDDSEEEYPVEVYSAAYLRNAIQRLTVAGTAQRAHFINRAIAYFYGSNQGEVVLALITQLSPQDALLRASLEQEAIDYFYTKHFYSLILTSIKMLSDENTEKRLSMMKQAVVYFYTNDQDHIAQRVIEELTEAESEQRASIMHHTIDYLQDNEQHNRVGALVRFLEEDEMSDDEGDEELSEDEV